MWIYYSVIVAITAISILLEIKHRKQNKHLWNLYQTEFEKRQEEIKQHLKSIKELAEEPELLKKEIADQEETIRQLGRALTEWEKNPLKMYFQQPIGQIAINESAHFTAKEVLNADVS
jgi:septal ring factor EnvC (AmiA/AmiB activator)